MEDPLALDRQVCYALAAASRSVIGLYRPVLEPLGLTHPQYLVMLALWEHDAVSPRAGVTSRADPAQGAVQIRSLRVRDLGDALLLDSATLSPLLKRLESSGLVTRQRNPDDERSLDVALTDEGAALRERALVVPGQIVARLGLPLAELESVRDQLTILLQASRSAVDRENPIVRA